MSTPNAERHVGILCHSCVPENLKWDSHSGKQFGIFLTTQQKQQQKYTHTYIHTTTIWSSHWSFRYSSQKKIRLMFTQMLHTNVYSSSTCNSQSLGIASISFSGQMINWTVAHPWNTNFAVERSRLSIQGTTWCISRVRLNGRRQSPNCISYMTPFM